MSNDSILHLILVLVALFVFAKVLGGLARKLRQPAVVGELLAGVLLGKSVLGLLDPANHVIHVLSEIGVVLLLFEIGLHTDLKTLTKVGKEATTVALVGVALPFGFGYLVATLLGLETVPAVVCGASLTATSVGISARTLSDLHQLETPEGKIVLGAAVLDDIVGLAILAVISAVVGSSLFASITGSLTIVGAFTVGILLHRDPPRVGIDRVSRTLGFFLIPVFFASVGAAVELSTLGDVRVLTIGAALILVGVFGKFAAGYAPFWFEGRKSMIGIAMIPRGEVGLVFARMGLATTALTPHLYSAVAMMVLVTTFVTPPLLAANVSRERGEANGDKPSKHRAPHQ